MAPAPNQAGSDHANCYGFRLMHTMLRVRDLNRSLDFYTRVLGMKLLLKEEHPEGRFTLAFVGYDDDWRQSSLELTYNWDRKDAYKHGSAFGHVAIHVADVQAVCLMLLREGVSIPQPPCPTKPGTISTAFIEDPDGYQIELLQLPK